MARGLTAYFISLTIDSMTDTIMTSIINGRSWFMMALMSIRVTNFSPKVIRINI